MTSLLAMQEPLWEPGTANGYVRVPGRGATGRGSTGPGSTGPGSTGPGSTGPGSTGPGRLISPATLAAARAGQGRGQDLVLRVPLEFGLGVALSGPERRFGPNPAAFGHDGAGGSAVSVDPESGIGFA